MSLSKKIISILAGAALAGAVFSTSNCTSGSAANIPLEQRVSEEYEPLHEGRKFVMCDELNCTTYEVENGELRRTGFVTPSLSSVGIKVNGKSIELKDNETIELEADDVLEIEYVNIDYSAYWRKFHNSKKESVKEYSAQEFVANFRGFDSGSQLHEDRGHEIRQQHLIEKYRNHDSTWSIQVLEKKDTDIKIGEIYIDYKGNADGKPTIFLKTVIDNNSRYNTRYFNNVLTAASNNLERNFGITLDWEFSYVNGRGMNTRAALDNIGPSSFRGRGAHLVFISDYSNDGVGGIANQCRKKMVVDIQDSAECSANITLHELGHILGLKYNNGRDSAHLGCGGYIMSPCSTRTRRVLVYVNGNLVEERGGGCEMNWHPESRRQIINRLNSGKLDNVLGYR